MRDLHKRECPLRRRKPRGKVVIRGIQFSHFHFLLSALGAAVVLRIAPRDEESHPDPGELCILRLVESLVHAVDAGLDHDRLRLWENDHH